MAMFCKMKAVIFVFGLALILFNPANSAEQGFAVGGLKFGIGLGITHNGNGADRIESAVVSASDTVRVTKQSNTQVGLLYEMHYFFIPEKEFRPWLLRHVFKSSFVPKDSWGHGPFVAVRSSDQEFISGIGAGWMLGLKQNKGGDGSSNSSWNMGLGFMVDPDSKRLASGFSDGQPLPLGESTIVLKEQSEVSVMLMFSFGF